MHFSGRLRGEQGDVHIEPALTFQIDFDFLADALRIATSDGGVATLALAPASIADFHGRFRAALGQAIAAGGERIEAVEATVQLKRRTKLPR